MAARAAIAKLLLSLLMLDCSRPAFAALLEPLSPPQCAALFDWPLCFEWWPAQPAGSARFLARGHDYQLLLGPTEAQLALRHVEVAWPTSPLDHDLLPAAAVVSARKVRLEFAGASPDARIQGEGATAGKINYLVGAHPTDWRANVTSFARVRVSDLYPGIDLVYYGNQQRLEYDFIVAPAADPATISLHFSGADKVEVDAQGALVLRLGTDEVRQPCPSLYQVSQGDRRPISGGYALKDAQTVTFTIGQYDRSLPLIIDPSLSYSAFVGGNAGDNALAVKVDGAGFVYVAGQTFSTQFPFDVSTNIQPGFAGGAINGDAFIAKFDNTHSNLVYFTYLGGSGDDGALDLAIDSAGNAYVTGFTTSTNFPVQPSLGVPGLANVIGGVSDTTFHVFPTDAFVAEINSTGTALVYSTYLGGSGEDVAGGIAVDPAGYAYVTGYTHSTNFPTTNAIQTHLGSTNYPDAFVVRIAPNGAGLVYSTYLGGTNRDEGQGIAADAAGFAYVTGYTASTNFPISDQALSKRLNNATNRTTLFDAFISRFAPDGALVFSSFFGGTNSDAGFRIAVNEAADAFVTGYSQSPDFPNTVTNLPLHVGANGTNRLNADAFLARFNFSSNAATLIYSALFGDTNDDVGWGVALDAAGDALVIGITASTNFPTFPAFPTNSPLRNTSAGGRDVFLTGFNSNATALLYSAYLGGSGSDYGYGISVDPAGNAYIVGRTLSTNFPVQAAFPGAPAAEPSLNSTNNAFVAKILLEPTLRAELAAERMQIQWRGFAPEFTLETAADPFSTAGWRSAPAVSSLSNGWHVVSWGNTNEAGFFRLKR